MSIHTIRDIAAFDAAHRDALSRLWFLGDVHGDFRHIGLALSRVRPEVTPRWLVFLGDLEIFDRSLGEIIAPLRKAFPEFGAQPTADEMAGKSLNDDETVIDAGTGEIIKPAPAAPQLPLYTDDQMDANLPKWQAAIDKGRTPEDIINLISSKYTMSEQQKARVLSLKPTPPQPAEDPFVAEMEAAEAAEY